MPDPPNGCKTESQRQNANDRGNVAVIQECVRFPSLFRKVCLLGLENRDKIDSPKPKFSLNALKKPFEFCLGQSVRPLFPACWV